MKACCTLWIRVCAECETYRRPTGSSPIDLGLIQLLRLSCLEKSRDSGVFEDVLCDRVSP
jgi:hypothetical protein